MGLRQPNANEATQTAECSRYISLISGICARCIPCGVDACREQAERIVNA